METSFNKSCFYSGMEFNGGEQLGKKTHTMTKPAFKKKQKKQNT